MFLDESVFGRKCFWTKVFLDEFFFFSNLDESVPNRKKSWDRFEKYGSLSPRYVEHVSGKRKEHRLEKYKSNLKHQRSFCATKFEDRSHEETERQQRCARSKALNHAKNTYKLKENDKAAFYSPAEEWVLPAASARGSEEREFAVDSGARYPYGQ